MHVDLNTFLKPIEQIQNQYMKEKNSETFNRKQTTQTFLSKCLKKIL